MAQRPIHLNLAAEDAANIKAEDDAAWITGILGGSASSVSCILPFGDRLQVTKVNNNLVRMKSGVYTMQGFCIKIPDSEDFVIETGLQGKTREDLLIAEYRRGSQRDSFQFKIVQGTPYDSTPIATPLAVHDLHAGGAVRQERIARITLVGTEIKKVEMVATVIAGLTETNLILSGKLDKTAMAVDSAKLGGASPATGAGADTIVKRTSSGNIVAAGFFENDKPLWQLYAAKEATENHTANINNPHNVNKAQVGLDKVQNFETATVSDILAGTAQRYTPASAVKGAIEQMAKNPIDNHMEDNKNPHSVDKTQVGLPDVVNMPVATVQDAVSGTPNRYLSAAVLKGALPDLTVGSATTATNAPNYLPLAGGKMTGSIDLAGKTLLLDTGKFGILISSNGLDVLIWDFTAGKGYKLNNDYFKIRYGASVPSTLQPGELFVQI